jgi:hypothetical protein
MQVNNSEHGQENKTANFSNGIGTTTIGKSKNIIEKFDDHAIIYLFGIAIMISLFVKPPHGDNITFALVVWIVFCLVYYTLKAIFITSCTIINWDRDNPGKPMISAGGLTEYDQGFAETIGKAAAEASRSSGSDCPCTLTEYDREMAKEIAREMKKLK